MEVAAKRRIANCYGFFKMTVDHGRLVAAAIRRLSFDLLNHPVFRIGVKLSGRPGRGWVRNAFTPPAFHRRTQVRTVSALIPNVFDGVVDRVAKHTIPNCRQPTNQGAFFGLTDDRQ